MRRFALVSLLLSSMCPIATTVASDNRLTEDEKEAGWRLLFNGRDHAGWRCSNGKSIATPIEDDSLLPYKSGGYLILHEREFGDFVLTFDVKWIDDQSNSGIFFRVEDPMDPVNTGFEVQVMGGAEIGKHEFGAIYDLAATTENAGKATGEWNAVEITCKGAQIAVRVNGRQVCTMDCNAFARPGLCPDGTHHKYALDGKPRAVKDFARRGYLGFQDHGQKVWYKNVKILEL